MFNDFRGYDDNLRDAMISIPPTLLVSSLGVMQDIRTCQTMDFKFPGDIIYCLGATGDEIGGSEYLAYTGEKISGKRYVGNKVPEVRAGEFKKTYVAFEKALRAGLVASSTSIERGGLGVALARSALAGMLGAMISLEKAPGDAARDDVVLYSESQGRILVTVQPSKKNQFEDMFAGLPFARIGEVSGPPSIEITGRNGGTIVRTDVDSLMKRYKGLFRDF